MTIPTYDPEIEQEAARMLREMESKQYTEFKRVIANHGEPLNPPDVLYGDFMDLLRELATLRRQTNERAEIVSALPDSFFADRSLSERVLRMVREWQRVLTILQKQEDQSELAALSAPLPDANLRAIEERAAKARNSFQKLSTLEALTDIDTLLAALRSRGGEGEAK